MRWYFLDLVEADALPETRPHLAQTVAEMFLSEGGIDWRCDFSMLSILEEFGVNDVSAGVRAALAEKLRPLSQDENCPVRWQARCVSLMLAASAAPATQKGA